MYERTRAPRLAPREVAGPAGLDPQAGFRTALGRVRKVLGAFQGGAVPWAPTRHLLAGHRAEPALELERLFVLGWLGWLDGSWAGAEGPLGAADERCRAVPVPAPAELPGCPPLEPGLLPARTAYWLARVRLLLGRESALADYEAALRRLGGSPQATAWYVDLLWRAGRTDRAEQVWKSVRTNKRVAACDEGPLIEARAALRRGELGPAERILRDAAPPGSGVAWVERHLLLAWALADLRRGDAASVALDLAAEGPYPARAMADWQTFVQTRLSGDLPGVEVTAPGWRDFIAGQRARLRQQPAEAATAYRAAGAIPAVAPFARYGLVCLGEEDAATVLASLPGCFLATRARVRQAVDRFRRREIGAGEFLEALAQPGCVRFHDDAVEQFQRLANALQARQVTLAYLRDLPAGCPDGPARRNALRIALELAGHRLALAEARFLTGEWTGPVESSAAADLLRRLGSLQFRDALAQDDPDGVRRAGRFLPGEPLVALAAGLLAGDAPEALPPVEPARTLAALAHDLAADRPWPADAADRLAALRGAGAYRGLAQALLLAEASRRGDADQIVTLLDDADAWRTLSPGLPVFAVRAIEAARSSHPAHPGWARVLPRWFSLWGSPGLSGPGSLAAAEPAAEVPAGVDPVAWRLHQAAAAAAREDDSTAVGLLQRAIADQPEQEASLRPALDALRRRADAVALAKSVAGKTQAALLVDLVASLAGLPEGKAILEAARSGDTAAVEARLGRLADRNDLPGRLCHHLALLALRQARAEEAVDSAGAVDHYRRAWRFWVGLLADTEALPSRPRELLVEHLLGLHRQAVIDHLFRDEPEPARLHWELLQEVALLGRERSAELGSELSQRTLRCREEVIAGFVAATRQAMRQGFVPPGWRADYELGTERLERLLDLAPDSVRILTALVDMAADWCRDLDAARNGDRLRAEVERFTPVALRLARLIEERAGGLPARLALSAFFRNRAEVAADLPTRIALLRQAMRYNPGNDEARLMLVQLGIRDDSPEANPEYDDG